jgi:pyridine nucleotide-disulfide oxidoreductase family protein
LTNLVLLGGGHSHVAVLKHFGMRPLPGVRLTLISRGFFTPYSGMLPGVIAGHYTFDDAHIDLQRLARFAGARACFDEVVGLDPVQRRVICRDRPPVSYDLLSINVGSTPNVSVPGAAEHAIPVKPIDRFLERFDALRQRVLARPSRSRVAVVGGGAGGVELLLSVQFALETLLTSQGRSSDRPELHLFTSSHTILPTHNGRVQAIFERVFGARGVHVHTGCRIAAVEHGRLRDEAGAAYEVDEMLWTTEARAAGWIGESGFDTDDEGFVRIGPTLQSVSHPEVFAAGDVASLVGHRLEKSGVYAVREGTVLARNLRRGLEGRTLARYRPQRQFLSLITTGGRHAVAARGPFALQGAWVWRWKDGIDRRFMRKYNELPRMPSAITIQSVRPDAAEAVALMAELDADLLTRYPGHPTYGLSQGDVEDQRTAFLLARIGPEVVGCGALRELGSGEGEIKRMFVRSAFRGRGVARHLLGAIEAEARRRGLTVLRLETGARQPEAIALYQSSGYRPCDPFGEYRVSALSRFFAKELRIVAFLLAVLAATSATAGCASAGTWPRIVAVSGEPKNAPGRGEWITTYDEAIGSIASIMGGQLGLPPLQASLFFYPDRDAFRGALEAEGYTPDFARQTAETLTAVSGFKRVLINDRSMEDVGWLFRIALLAHELTHTLQYEFAGGKRGTSDQWLREGFAEWVEVEVLVRLGFTTRSDAQRVLRNRIRDAGVNRWPPLSGMVTFPQWVDLAQRFGQEALYGYAMLAAEYLVERHGMSAAIGYFQLFGASDDRVANFRRAFGQDLAEFEAAFNVQLAAMLR